MTDSPKVALFGGTFDPVHQGHLEIAVKAVERLRLDTVIFIPCRQSPHKERAPGAGDADRLTMLRAATSAFPWAHVDQVELLRPPPSYTSDTVVHFQNSLPPGTRLHLLIGSDQWDSLPRWHQVDFLRKNLTFIVVRRTGHPKPRPKYRACFLPGEHPASSSQIRQDLRNGKQARWLPATVQDHIEEHGLYLSTT